MFKDETGEIVPAIVSEELWDKANDVLERRSKDVKNRQGKCNHGNLLTGKLFCTDCGATYYRRDAKDRQGNKIQSGYAAAKSKTAQIAVNPFLYTNPMSCRFCLRCSKKPPAMLKS